MTRPFFTGVLLPGQGSPEVMSRYQIHSQYTIIIRYNPSTPLLLDTLPVHHYVPNKTGDLHIYVQKKDNKHNYHKKCFVLIMPFSSCNNKHVPQLKYKSVVTGHGLTNYFRHSCSLRMSLAGNLTKTALDHCCLACIAGQPCPTSSGMVRLLSYNELHSRYSYLETRDMGRHSYVYTMIFCR